MYIVFTVYLESGLLVFSSRALVLTRHGITLVLCKNRCFYVNPRRVQNYHMLLSKVLELENMPKDRYKNIDSEEKKNERLYFGCYVETCI